MYIVITLACLQSSDTPPVYRVMFPIAANFTKPRRENTRVGGEKSQFLYQSFCKVLSMRFFSAPLTKEKATTQHLLLKTPRLKITEKKSGIFTSMRNRSPFPELKCELFIDEILCVSPFLSFHTDM